MSNILKTLFNSIKSSDGSIANEISEYKKTKEREKTKRSFSHDRKEECIAGIQAQRDVLITALDNDLELNQSKIDKTFKVIDKALESGNNETLNLGLSTMVKIGEKSSIANLSNLTKQLENKNNIIDL